LVIDGFAIGVSAAGYLNTSLGPLKLDDDTMTLGKIKLNLSVSTDSDDKVHWSLKDANVVLKVDEFDVEST